MAAGEVLRGRLQTVQVAGEVGGGLVEPVEGPGGVEVPVSGLADRDRVTGRGRCLQLLACGGDGLGLPVGLVVGGVTLVAGRDRLAVQAVALALQPFQGGCPARQRLGGGGGGGLVGEGVGQQGLQRGGERGGGPAGPVARPMVTPAVSSAARLVSAWSAWSATARLAAVTAVTSPGVGSMPPNTDQS